MRRINTSPYRSFALLIFLALLVPTVHAQNLRTAKDYLKRGVQRFSKGDLEGALTDYTTAIELNPMLAEAHLNRGKARRAKGDLDGAIEDYERAIEIDPATAHNNREITQA
jgi:tetratricopeptide (TPR) repeat protein